MEKPSKKIIYLSLTILILVLLFVLYKIYPSLNPTKISNTPTNTSNTNNPFPTNGGNSNTNNKTTNNENPETINTENKIIKDDEYIISKKINENISDWENTKDPDLIKNSLLLSKDSNNESFLESWKTIMMNDSSEILKQINNNSSKETLTTAFNIFQWFIELSGEYEKLSPEKQFEIKRQYLQIELYLNQSN